MRHLNILALLLLCLIQSLQAQEDPLKKRVTLEYESITLPHLFTEIKKKYKINFSYAHELVSERRKLKVLIVNLPLDQALKTILYNQGLSFECIGKQIVIKRGNYQRKFKQGTKNELNIAADKTFQNILPNTEVNTTVASLDSRGPFVEEILEPLPVNAFAARNVLYQDNREAVKQLKLEVATWKDSVSKIKDPKEKFFLQHEINRFVEGIETRLIQIKDSIRSMRTKESVQEMGTNLKVSIQQVKESIGAASDSLPRKRRMFERKSTDSTISQMDDGLEIRPGQFTLVYPIGTSWIYSPKYKNTVSINLLFGINGGIKGVDAGGMVNVVRRNLIGVQVAGYTNIILGKLEGVQASGFCNIVGGQADGVQASGYFNFAGKSSTVGQAAGFVNVINGDNAGFQASGFSNVTTGDVIGFQASGFSNVCGKEVSGFQVSGFSNVSKGDVYGLQVCGFVNIAKKVHGTQIGLVNICDSVSKGTPIGLINIVKRNGYMKWEVWGNEIFFLNGSYKVGTEKLYAILTIGIRPEMNFRYGLGIGLGYNAKIDNKNAINIDLTSFENMTDEPFSNNHNRINRLQATYSRKLFGGTSVFIGPSVNLLVASDWQENKYNAAPSWSFFKTENTGNDNTKLNLWIGLSGGIRF